MNKLYEYMDPSRGRLNVNHDNEGKRVFLDGIFIQADVRNHNQRVYPIDEIRRAVENINERIRSGTVLGELDHPPELNINLDRVSHMITKMWLDGNNGCGKLEILDRLPMGQVARGMLDHGVKLGVSSRGSGEVDARGQVSEFEIVTVDIVAQPSAPNAYPKPIYESLFNMRGGSRVYAAAVDAANDVRATKDLNKELVKFIKDLKIKY